jgi:perosamine synthetase
VELPPSGGPNRLHSWHLFPLRLNLDCISIDRNRFIEELKLRGVMTSVHWRPLHLHPYYRDSFGFTPDDFPNATWLFERNLSLPLFPSMTEDEIDQVIHAVRDVSAGFRR